MSSIFKDGVLFNYQYGGPGMDEVVIPKGHVLVDLVTGDFSKATGDGHVRRNEVVGGLSASRYNLDGFTGFQVLDGEGSATRPQTEAVVVEAQLILASGVGAESAVTRTSNIVLAKPEAGIRLRLHSSGRAANQAFR